MLLLLFLFLIMVCRSFRSFFRNLGILIYLLCKKLWHVPLYKCLCFLTICILQLSYQLQILTYMFVDYFGRHFLCLSKHTFFLVTVFYCCCKIWILKTIIKGILMQIWKSANIFVFRWKQYVEDFTLKHFLLLEICARDIC